MTMQRRRMQTWSSALEVWRTELLAGDIATGTIRLRVHYLRRFARVCSSPQFATRDAIVAWLATPERWSPETRKSARAAFVAFYTWYYDQGCLPENPAADLPTVHVPAGTPRPADPDDVARALREARPREWLMLMLGAVDGMRRAEIAVAHSGDLRGNMLQILGKGKRRRQVPVPDVIARAIRARGPGYLFPSPRGGPLTAGHVGKLISRALPEGTTPHQLRHLAASDLRERGVPVEEVQILLGHARIDTTMRYTRVVPRALPAASSAAAAALLIASTARAGA